MAQKKKRNPRYVSDIGIAVYPYLLEPDEYKGKLDYKTKLKLDTDAQVKNAKGESLGSMAEFLDKAADASYEKFKEKFKGKLNSKGKPIKVERADPYYFDDTGAMICSFKLAAHVEPENGKPFTQSPAIFDSKGKPFDGDKLWGGSKLRISFEVIPYHIMSSGDASVSLRMKAVQVLELNQGGNQQADSFGFGEEEGYESSGASAEEEGFGSEEGESSDEPFETTDENGDF
ncbi:hypothetical protein [Endozoicomonas ascidiicola]|uniref:hypothetical protein n=1 Tax=Endozoicomonas ascidiicola TaxID=1698521 RepID=UPI000829AAF7|nr:hypothetical protein [Endozoicomonas ascidiicola]